jgi:hypothetical protein
MASATMTIAVNRAIATHPAMGDPSARQTIAVYGVCIVVFKFFQAVVCAQALDNSYMAGESDRVLHPPLLFLLTVELLL